MNETLRQQFEEQLTYLPEINQRALRSFDWATQLISIGHQFGLHIDELDELQVETMLVLVGLTSPDEYEKELIERLAISPAEAAKIIDQVNKQVFQPIHDYIVAGEQPRATTAPEPADIMQSAGIEITHDETPVTPEPVPIVRAGGNRPVGQMIPDTKPVGSPLQFHPNAEKSTVSDIPITNPVVENTTNPIQLSREKLQKMYLDRQKVVDATLGNTEQPTM